MKDNISIELPSLTFKRSQTYADSIVNNVEFTVKAESSELCLHQFRNMLSLLEKVDKKENAKIKNNKRN